MENKLALSKNPHANPLASLLEGDEMKNMGKIVESISPEAIEGIGKNVMGSLANLRNLSPDLLGSAMRMAGKLMQNSQLADILLQIFGRENLLRICREEKLQQKILKLLK